VTRGSIHHRQRSASRSLRSRHSWVAAAMMLVIPTAVGVPLSASAQSDLPVTTEWLSTVNLYRTASGLAPVTANDSASAGISAHLHYLQLTPQTLKSGAFASAHTENPASAYYTVAGDAAGRSSNLAFGTSSSKGAIDVWMGAPFHAIGILRPSLRQVAFARDASTGDAGLDVIRGIDTSVPPPSSPVLFPGPNSSVPLTSFLGESPDPLETCSYVQAGLPLIALLPQAPDQGLTASLTDGAGHALTTCVVDEHTYRSSDAVYGPTGLSILAGEHAVLVIPRLTLTKGRFTARISRPGVADISWSFYVTGPAGEPVPADGIVRVHASPTGQATVIGKVTLLAPTTAGTVAAFPCTATAAGAVRKAYPAKRATSVPIVATTDTNGDLCISATSQTAFTWDQVGTATGFVTTTPVRRLDTRTGTKPKAGAVRVLRSAGIAAGTAIGTLTVIAPEAKGSASIYPCAAGRPTKPSVTYTRNGSIAVLTAAADTSGNLCVQTSAKAHLVWDQLGSATAVSLTAPRRLLDTSTA
jgi:hypothetical protein